MTAEVLQALIGANLAASAAILVVLAVRVPVRHIAGARVAYGLWLIAPLAALASFLPPLELARPMIAAPPIRPAAQAAVQVLDTAFSQAAPGADPAAVLLVLWGLGGVLVLAVLLRRQRLAMLRLGALTREGAGSLRAALPAAGPAVIGLLTPRIVLPADFEGRFDARERGLILAHEQAHLAAGDVRVNALVCLALCLNWFNPLVMFAAELIRADQELARDEAVVAAHPGQRKIYALALLKAQTGAGALPVGCYWPARSPAVLKARILMLSRAAPARAARLGGGLLVGALALGAGYGAWAVNPQAAAPQVVAAIAPLIPAPPAPPVRVAAAPAVTAPSEPPRGSWLPQEGRVAEAARLMATGEPAPPHQPGALARPDWIQMPTYEEVQKAMPEGARQLGRTGSVILNCMATDSGGLEGCTIYREYPVGVSLGEAALRLAPKFRMRPTAGGVPVGGSRVAVPIDFEVDRSVTLAAQTSSPPPPIPLTTPLPPRPVSTTAFGITPPMRPSVIANPQWLSQPTLNEVMAVFPERSMRLNREGKAMIQCVALANGSLSECAVVSETPAGLGFGAAALRLAPKFRMSPQTRQGAPVEGAKVMVPLAFALDGPPLSPDSQ